MTLSSTDKERLASFLPFLETVQENPALGGEWVAAPGAFPWVRYTQAAQDVFTALGAAGLMDQQYMDHLKPEWLQTPEALQTLSAEELRVVATAVVRRERFEEGFLLAVLRSGYLLALVRRLCAN